MNRNRRLLSILSMGLIPMIDKAVEKEVEKLDLEEKPCMNKCGKPRTPGKLFCSAECCKDFKQKKKEKKR